MNKLKNINNLIKTGAVVLFTCFIVSSVSAQTEPMYSQYMFNMSSINPAYVGSRGAMNLNYFGRNQWSGISGAPKTNLLSLDGATIGGRFGLGVQLYNDQIGVYKTNGANFMASTRVKVSDKGILSGGIQFGLMNQRIDRTDVVNVYDKSGTAFQTNKSSVDPTLGLGIFYNTDKFYAGASVPNLLKSTNFNLDQNHLESNFHLFVTAGYVFDVNEDVKFKPSTMIKVVRGAPVEFDFNTNVWLKDIVGLGVSYRTNDAVVGMAELQLNKQLRVGYAYDYTTSALRTFAGSTNEVMFRFEFGKESKNIKSTRYF